MEGKLSLTTPAHILAASPMIRKELVEKLRVRRVETNTYEEAHDVESECATALSPAATQLLAGREPVYSLPLLELDVLVGD